MGNAVDIADFDTVLEGFRQFYTDHFLPAVGQASGGGINDFDNSQARQALLDVKSYVLDKQYDFADTPLEILGDGYPKPPSDLLRNVQVLYMIWFKSTLLHQEKLELSPEQLTASIFMLTLHSQFRMDFALDINLQHDLYSESLFTYSDIHNIIGGNRDHIKNLAASARTVHMKTNQWFMYHSPWCEHPGLRTYYVNINKANSQATVINHSDALYIASKTRAYKPTRFSFSPEGNNIAPDFGSPKSISEKLKSQLTPIFKASDYSRFLSDARIPDDMAADLLSGKSLKISLPVFLRFEWALAKRRNQSADYKPFTVIPR